MTANMPKYMVFCDFDGTITKWESAEGLWEYYLEDAFQPILKDFVERDVPTCQAIKQLFGMIPSSRYHEMFAYIKTLELRPGFEEFLDFLESRQIPLVVISGGIEEMIDHMLKPYKDRLTGCHCCTLSTEEEYLTISSPYDDGIDLIRKEVVMEEYPHQTSIFFGDSFTDRNAAQHADIVFARDRLDIFLNELDIPHHTFNTFHDAIEVFMQEEYTNISES